MPELRLNVFVNLVCMIVQKSSLNDTLLAKSQSSFIFVMKTKNCLSGIPKLFILVYL